MHQGHDTVPARVIGRTVGLDRGSRACRATHRGAGVEHVADGYGGAAGFGRSEPGCFGLS